MFQSLRHENQTAFVNQMFFAADPDLHLSAQFVHIPSSRAPYKANYLIEVIKVFVGIEVVF